MKKMTTTELIDELKSRGYYTDLIFCRDDVQWQLNQVNKDEVGFYNEKILLTDNDMDIIFEDHVNVEAINESVNGSIYDGIMTEYYHRLLTKKIK